VTPSEKVPALVKVGFKLLTGRGAWFLPPGEMYHSCH